MAHFIPYTLTLFALHLACLQSMALSIEWKTNDVVDWALFCDFPGNDIGNVTVPGEACATSCIEVPACTHFSWTNRKGGTCYHKGSVVKRADAVSHNPSGSTTNPPDAVCGLLHARDPTEPPSPPQPTQPLDSPVPSQSAQRVNASSWQTSEVAYWALSCGFSEKNTRIGWESVRGELCAASCAKVKGCTHFSWTPERKGTCTHIRGHVTRADAIVRDVSGAACGILRRPQSFSLPGASSVDEKPVKTAQNARPSARARNRTALIPVSVERTRVKKSSPGSSSVSGQKSVVKNTAAELIKWETADIAD